MLYLAVLLGALQLSSPGVTAGRSLFERGQTWEQFLKGMTVQRDRWLENASWTNISPGLVQRFTHVNKGLRLVIVAEDWCPDSVNTVPYIARLGGLADVPVRIVDRTVGQPLLDRHRTPDGRTATPTVVLLRDGRDAGAWVERPRVLQNMFRSLRTDPEMAKRLADRQSWYDSDHGETTLSELVALAEQTALPSEQTATRMRQ